MTSKDKRVSFNNDKGVSFDFDITPEPRYAAVNVTEGNFVDIVFTVQNRSQRAVRVEPIVNALVGAKDPLGNQLPNEDWENWFTIIEGQDIVKELTFDSTSVRQITVRITLPNKYRIRHGVYTFQLLIVGVDDPDQEFAASDAVTVNVSGPSVNINRFVVIALLILAVIVVIAVGAARLATPPPLLDVALQAEKFVKPGEVAKYTVVVTNSRGTAASNILLQYKQPPGVIGATAFVVPTATFRYCEEDARDIQCSLGTLQSNESITVQIDYIPGPFPTYPAIITNTETVTVSVPRNNENEVNSSETILTVKTSQVLTPTELSVAIDPSVGTAVLNETVTYNVMAWNNFTNTEVITLTYHLPPKMYYEEFSNRCELEDDYFTLICISDKLNHNAGHPDIASFLIKAIPSDTAPSDNAAHFSSKVVDAQYVTDEGVKPINEEGTGPANFGKIRTSVNTRSVNSALQFNGFNSWAQLGYKNIPKTFTVEMWVHPVSTSDGQSFIGTHLEAEEDVRNMFLVGYWNEGLHVELDGETQTLTETNKMENIKSTERFHLAVVVKNLNAESSEVTVYVNGRIEDNWAFDKAFNGETTMPWVLGQDWDPGSQGPIESDFFHGSMSDVRIWNTARRQDQIKRYMNLRPPSNADGLVANWRLEPITKVDDLELADRVNPENNGTRLFADWGEPIMRFGAALVFDGQSDVLYYYPSSKEDTAGEETDNTVAELDGISDTDVEPNAEMTDALSEALANSVATELDEAVASEEVEQATATIAEEFVNTILQSGKWSKYTSSPNTWLSWKEYGAQIEPVINIDDDNSTTNNDVISETNNIITDTNNIITTTNNIITDTNSILTETINITATNSAWVSVNNIITSTMSAWVFVEGTPTVEQLIVGTFGSDIFALTIDNDGHVTAVYQAPDGQTLYSIKDEQVIAANRWTHYAVVLDADASRQRITLFRNGQEVKAKQSPLNPLEKLTNPPCPPGVYMGGLCPAAINNKINLAGRIDEVRLWNRALGPDEINSWRNLPGIMFNEVAYWAFDDSPKRSGNKICDREPGTETSQFTCVRHYNANVAEGEDVYVQNATTVEGPTWIEADSLIEQQFLDRP